MSNNLFGNLIQGFRFICYIVPRNFTEKWIKIMSKASVSKKWLKTYLKFDCISLSEDVEHFEIEIQL